MKTISFHSTKGGVGRTAAVVNFAKALGGIGKKVIVLELDFDAPGLALKSGHNELGVNGPQGYVDYLGYFNSHDPVFGNMKKQNYDRGTNEIAAEKVAYLQRIVVDHWRSDESGNAGQIKYILAGSDSQKYWWKLSSNWFHDLFSISKNEYSADGNFLLHSNREKLEGEFDLLSKIIFHDGLFADVLLIDCRSSREYSSVPLYYWSDVVVHMFPHNREGVFGADRVASAFYSCNMQYLKKQGGRFIPVVCRIPEAKIMSGKAGGFHLSQRYSDFLQGLSNVDDLFSERPINATLNEQAVFFIQEAVFATHDESMLMEPKIYLKQNGHVDDDFYHHVLCDQCKLFEEIIKHKCGPNLDSIDGNHSATDLVKILSDGILGQRFDLNVMQTDDGQAINADGNKNVLLRNESVQTLIQTLEQRVLNGEAAPSIGAPSIKDRAHWAFFESGVEIGKSYARGLLSDKKALSAGIVTYDFEGLVNIWCQYDGQSAAFGKMSPVYANQDDSILLELTWTKCFLLKELDGSNRFEINYSSLCFLEGYVLGNCEVYDAYVSETDGSDELIPAERAVGRLKVVVRRPNFSGLIDSADHGGLGSGVSSDLIFTVSTR